MHFSGPRVIRPFESSSRFFCCLKYMLMIPRACGSLNSPSSLLHSLPVVEIGLSQLQFSLASSQVFASLHGHEPLN